MGHAPLSGVGLPNDPQVVVWGTIVEGCRVPGNSISSATLMPTYPLTWEAISHVDSSAIQVGRQCDRLRCLEGHEPVVQSLVD
jgi:hypothetical protein